MSKKNLTIDKAVELLRRGEIVAFPTETVYGLGADAWNPAAVKKVFEVKGRPSDNPLIVHIATSKWVRDFAGEVPDAAEKLMEQCWPGPLTLIFKKKPGVLDLVTGGLDTVALRWPDHPLSQQLIFRAGPLVAPSANSSGRPSPTRSEHVKEDFGEEFPVVDGGPTRIGLESTVLDVSTTPFTIYRPGYVGRKQIAEITGQPVELGAGTGEQTRSPGTRYTHYAPDADVGWLDSETNLQSGNSLCLLHSQSAESADHIINYRKDYQVMAAELYDRFRQADHQGYQKILIEPFSPRQLEETLVQALQNRIGKAMGE